LGFTRICGELWLAFVFAGVHLGLLTVFLRVRALENAVFLSQKRGQNVVIRVVAVVLSLVETPDNNAFGSAVDESGFPVTLFSVGLMRNDIVCLNCSAIETLRSPVRAISLLVNNKGPEIARYEHTKQYWRAQIPLPG
jgi:hypothetical protein